jgi:hypothetical protein
MAGSSVEAGGVAAAPSPRCARKLEIRSNALHPTLERRSGCLDRAPAGRGAIQERVHGDGCEDHAREHQPSRSRTAGACSLVPTSMSAVASPETALAPLHAVQDLR